MLVFKWGKGQNISAVTGRYSLCNMAHKKNGAEISSPHCDVEHIVPSLLNKVIICQEPVTPLSVEN